MCTFVFYVSFQVFSQVDALNDIINLLITESITCNEQQQLIKLLYEKQIYEYHQMLTMAGNG